MISRWGPWSPTCPVSEKPKQLRCLQGIIACHLGSNHPLITLLRVAETDAMRFVGALDAMEKLPALHRRRILSTFGAITYSRREGRQPLPEPDGYDAERDFAGSIDEAYRAVRERVAAGGPGWTPKAGGEP